MEESALVLAAQGGNVEAFGALVRLVQHGLVACARQLTRNDADAEDMAQETLLEAYCCLPTLREPGKFRAWLFGILRHKCFTHLRKHRRGDVPLHEVADVLAAPLPADRGELLALLDALPQADREVLAARYLQGLDFADIAEVLGTSENAVRIRVSRARAKLRQLADAEDDARTAQALAVLLALPLDHFSDRVLTEVSTMTQLAGTAPCAAATATAKFTLPAFVAGAVGKAVAVVAVVAALGGGYYAAGTKGLVPLPPGVAGAVGVATATTTAHAPGSSEEKMQHVLDVTLRWIEANGERLPDSRQWPTQVGLSEEEILSPDGQTKYSIPPLESNGVTTVQQMREHYSNIPEAVELLQGRMPVVIEMLGPNTDISARVHSDKILVGFLDGTVGWVTVPGNDDHAASDPKTQCEANIRQLVITVIMMADDNGERILTVKQLTQVLAGETVRLGNGGSMRGSSIPPKVLTCPEHGTADSYAYNRAAAGVAQGSIREPHKLVLFYEVRDGQPDFRHDGKMHVAFADGNVKLVTPEEFRALGVK